MGLLNFLMDPRPFQNNFKNSQPGTSGRLGSASKIVVGFSNGRKLVSLNSKISVSTLNNKYDISLLHNEGSSKLSILKEGKQIAVIQVSMNPSSLKVHVDVMSRFIELAVRTNGRKTTITSYTSKSDRNELYIIEIEKKSSGRQTTIEISLRRPHVPTPYSITAAWSQDERIVDGVVKLKAPSFAHETFMINFKSTRLSIYLPQDDVYNHVYEVVLSVDTDVSTYYKM